MADESYAYDANGNRIGSSVEIGAYNRLLSDGTYAYEYDYEGNLSKKTLSATGEYTKYAWDHRNRLKSVTEHDSQDVVVRSVQYSYDAFNQLVKRVVDHDGNSGSAAIEQTFYLYDQGQVALEFRKWHTGSATASHLSHRYLWNPGVVDQLFTDENVNDLFDAEQNETLWALTDRQGSVTDLVDSNATLRLHRAFDSFGNITEETHYDADGDEVIEGQTGYLDAAFAYTGRFFDSVTGLQNNLNRWYDASTGRWLSEDPIGFAAGDANLYRYVGNGPVNGTDPSGLWEDWGFGHPGSSIPPEPEPPGGPPASIPGGPWKWCPNPQNNRGGVYAPKDWTGPNPPFVSWEPGFPGHWDYDDGHRSRQRYDRDGNPITPGEAHPIQDALDWFHKEWIKCAEHFFIIA